MTFRHAVIARATLPSCLLLPAACQQPPELTPAKMAQEPPIACAEVPAYREEGVASLYGDAHQGKTMYEIVGNLEARGLLSRTEDPENRRVLLVSLTDAGNELLTICDRKVDQLEKNFSKASMRRIWGCCTSYSIPSPRKCGAMIRQLHRYNSNPFIYSPKPFQQPHELLDLNSKARLRQNDRHTRSNLAGRDDLFSKTILPRLSPVHRDCCRARACNRRGRPRRRARNPRYR